MSEFRKVEPLLLNIGGVNDGHWAANHPSGAVMIRGIGGWEPWSYDEALALRDWLNKALGDAPPSQTGEV